MKKVSHVLILAAMFGAHDAFSGTIIADKVVAQEVQTSELSLPPPFGPEILYYNFETNGGGVVTDSSGNGNHGTASRSLWNQGGALLSAGAGSFDGSAVYQLSGDYVTLPATINFPALDDYSVSVWFKHDGGGYTSTNQYGHKLVDKSAESHDWCLVMTAEQPSAGTVGVLLNEGGTTVWLSSGAGNYMDNAWHHAVVTRAGGLGQLWVDGQLKAQTNNMVTVNNSSPVCIGNSYSSNMYHRVSWSGRIDEFRVFDYAVSSNDVSRLYQVGSLLVTPPPVAVRVTTNLQVNGSLTVTGKVTFAGAVYTRPRGDLACGIYTNTP